MHARLVFAVSLTHARTCDCFRSRGCRGNANSHARGDIHNTMPLITHCLCDGAATIPLFFPRLPRYRRCLTRKCTSRIRANHNKICNAPERSVIRSLPAIFPPPYYDFLPTRERERDRENTWRRLAYPFRKTETADSTEGYTCTIRDTLFIKL